MAVEAKAATVRPDSLPKGGLATATAADPLLFRVDTSESGDDGVSGEVALGSIHEASGRRVGGVACLARHLLGMLTRLVELADEPFTGGVGGHDHRDVRLASSTARVRTIAGALAMSSQLGRNIERPGAADPRESRGRSPGPQHRLRVTTRSRPHRRARLAARDPHRSARRVDEGRCERRSGLGTCCVVRSTGRGLAWREPAATSAAEASKNERPRRAGGRARS